MDRSRLLYSLRPLRRILLIRLSALGDVILVEPVVRALRQLAPSAQIELVTDARYAPLMEQCLGLHRVIAYARRGEDRGLRGVRRVRKRLGLQPFDVVIDLQGKLRTKALARSIAATHRLVLKKRNWKQGLLSLFGQDTPITNQHTTEFYLSMLTRLGFQDPKFDRQPRFLRPAQKTSKKRLRIGLVPSAAHATKRWPAARFAALADQLSERFAAAEFVMIGGASDRALLQEVVAGARVARFDSIDVSAIPVEGLPEVLSSLQLLVGVDTGPAHLASALQVPVVSIFGPTSPQRWAPLGPRDRVVSLALPCSPCSNVGTKRCPLPGKGHDCLVDLEVAPVLNAAQAILEGELS